MVEVSWSCRGGGNAELNYFILDSEGYKSPYYNDSHRALQKFMRDL